jgi:aspartyl/asparaginyl beta-hydroxylase (cupin superfamily)
VQKDVKTSPGGEEAITALLCEFAANQLPHQHGRTLQDHLLGTRKIVRRWLQPGWVQDAAALHTVYGTSVYRRQLITVSQRAEVRAAAGDKAERLAYLFGAVNRRDLFAWFESEDRSPESPPTFRSRFAASGPPEILTRQEAGHLLVLQMANLAEQAADPDGLPGRWLAQVSRWGSLLARAGLPVPPIFGGCQATISAADEAKALASYRAGVSVPPGRPGRAAHFDAVLERCPWPGEPWAWKAWLAASQGNVADARLFASEARRRLTELGTCWDKRLSFDDWLSLAGLLEQCPGLGPVDRLPSPDLRRPESALGALRHFRTGRQRSGGSLADALSAGERNGQRFLAYARTFRGSQERRARIYPGLAARPWHDPDRFEITARLEASYGVIRDEILRVDRPAFRPESEAIPRKGAWDVLMLFEHGGEREEACRRCPVTASLIHDNPAVATPEGLIYFSRMAPGTHVAAHRGPTNIRLRCHLAIQVPEGDCGIRVGDEVRRWEEGRCLVFDDHFEHEAWNRTLRDRIVLIVDIWHPDLTDPETALLTALDSYSLAHARRAARRAQAGVTPGAS